MNASIVLQLLNKNSKHPFVQEVQFDLKRKWRFDFACEVLKVAVEVEGGAFTNGRHTRGKGYIGDMEKYNRAVELGWIVLRYTPTQMGLSTTYQQVENVCKRREQK